MNVTYQDIQEIKHLKKKRLVRFNLVMLLFFVLLGYLIATSKMTLTIGLLSVILWSMVIIELYTLITGKFIGTKINRRVQEFDRRYLGQKRWKRKKVIETIIICGIGIFTTVFLFVEDFSSARLDFPLDTFPFIGLWIGHNIWETARIGSLSDD